MNIKEIKTNYFIGEDGSVYKKLKPQKLSNGYMDIGLGKDDKHNLVHRLVAKVFIPNPENKNTVDHIDGNRSNNHYTNLRWTTRSENLLYGYERRNDTPIKYNLPCNLYVANELVGTFISVKDASIYAEKYYNAKATMLRKYYKNKNCEIRCIDYPIGE